MVISKYKIMFHKGTKTSANHIVEVARPNHSLCGKDIYNFTEQNTKEGDCKACKKVLERRQQEEKRRINGTHGQKPSLLGSTWFDLKIYNKRPRAF